MNDKWKARIVTLSGVMGVFGAWEWYQRGLPTLAVTVLMVSLLLLVTRAKVL